MNKPWYAHSLQDYLDKHHILWKCIHRGPFNWHVTFSRTASAKNLKCGILTLGWLLLHIAISQELIKPKIRNCTCALRILLTFSKVPISSLSFWNSQFLQLFASLGASQNLLGPWWSLLATIFTCVLLSCSGCDSGSWYSSHIPHPVCWWETSEDWWLITESTWQPQALWLCC